jgi:hypothetical protein
MLVKKVMLPVAAGMLLCACSTQKKTAQQKVAPTKTIQPVVAKTDTTKKGGNNPKPYKEVITAKAITDSGLFIVHKIDEKYFWELPDSLLNRDLLIVNRIAKAATGGRAGMLGYAGDEIGESVVQFAKGPANKLFIKTISYQEISKDSTENGMFRSVMNSNLQPLVAAFDIKAYRPDSTGVVIDVTDYLEKDNDVLFFDNNIKKALNLGGLQADRSYVEKLSSFPLNVEIRTLKTFSQTFLGFATYELNSSIVLLPKQPMQSRSFDERVGYFATGYKDFDANPQGVENTNMITRWRLEPKDEEIEKYKRGELVEPKKPIVFYVDPTTPKKWVPFLIQGVNDWQKAFEKAGFKNAIYALEAPTNDPEFSLWDAQHNAIVYKPSTIANASGPHVHDPRSGEILETHINWYHNVMQLIHDWYMIQAGAIDPKARKMEFDDSLMGQLIRFVSSHEVGHTLGLRHNFGASSTIPVDSLRSKRWVEANGICPSIMDYARFNYVAQPEDHISEKGIFPRIGVYDEWAIEWGYRWLPELKTQVEEKVYLNKWVIEKLNKDKRLWFGSEMNTVDPRCQSEDLGDNAIKASYYGIKNLKRILSELYEWTKVPNENYDNFKRVYKQVFDQYQRYLFHVANNIGGILFTSKTVEQAGPYIEFTFRKKQKEAVQFLQQELFTTPTWLMNKQGFSQTGLGNVYSMIYYQKNILDKIISQISFQNLLYFETAQPSDAYTVSELLDDLKKGIWSEVKNNKPIDLYRRNLQKLYAERLVKMILSDKYEQQNLVEISARMANNPTDILSLLKGHIKELIGDINRALPLYKDQKTRMHLEDVRDRLKEALEPRK